MSIQNAPLPLYSKQGRVFLQRTELQPFTLLENHGIANMTFPAPAATPVRAQSTATRTANLLIDITMGDMDSPTFTVPTMLAQVRNYLMAITQEKVNIQLLTGPSGNPTQYGAAKFGFGWVLAMRGPGTVAQGAVFNNAGEGPPVTFETPFSAVLGPIPIDWTTELQLKTANASQTRAANGVFCLPAMKDEDGHRRVLPGEVGIIVGGDTSYSDVAFFTDGLRGAPTMAATALSTLQGWYAGDPLGGTVWSLPVLSVTGYGDKYEARFILSAATSTFTTAPIMAYTTDFGTTWQYPTKEAGDDSEAGDYINRLWFVNAAKIYGVGGQTAKAKVWMSTNGGSVFTGTQLTTACDAFNDIMVMGNGIGYIVGPSNTIYKCTDFDDWALVTGHSIMAGNELLCVAVKNSTGTVFVGSDNAGLSCVLMASIDGGTTWTDMTSAIQGITPTKVKRVRFDPESGEFGFAVCETADGDMIVRTTNGGTTWQKYDLGVPVTDATYNDLQVIGPNHMVAVGATSTAANSLSTIVLAQSNFEGSRLE